MMMGIASAQVEDTVGLYGLDTNPAYPLILLQSKRSLGGSTFDSCFPFFLLFFDWKENCSSTWILQFVDVTERDGTRSQRVAFVSCGLKPSACVCGGAGWEGRV